MRGGCPDSSSRLTPVWASWGKEGLESTEWHHLTQSALAQTCAPLKAIVYSSGHRKPRVAGGQVQRGGGGGADSAQELAKQWAGSGLYSCCPC